MQKSDQKESTQEQARKARADHHDKCSLMPGRRQVKKKAVVGVVCQREFHGRHKTKAKRTAKALQSGVNGSR